MSALLIAAALAATPSPLEQDVSLCRQIAATAPVERWFTELDRRLRNRRDPGGDDLARVTCAAYWMGLHDAQLTFPRAVPRLGR